MSPGKPSSKPEPSLESTIAAKEKAIQTKTEKKDDIVTEATVTATEKALDAKIAGFSLEGKYKEDIQGKLKEVKDKWQTKIKAIKDDGAEALKTATTDLVKELKGFTEQKEVRDVIDVVEPFFKNKAAVVKAISFSKYKKSSGHWRAINTRLHAIGIKRAQIIKLQEHLGIKVDGKVGPETMTAMFGLYQQEKTVEFDDNDTVVLEESGAKDFAAYDADSKIYEEALGGKFDDETSTFTNEEWTKLEAKYKEAYSKAKTLDEIIQLRRKEEAEKQALAKKFFDAAKAGQQAVEGAGEDSEANISESEVIEKMLAEDPRIKQLGFEARGNLLMRKGDDTHYYQVSISGAGDKKTYTLHRYQTLDGTSTGGHATIDMKTLVANPKAEWKVDIPDVPEGEFDGAQQSIDPGQEEVAAKIEDRKGTLEATFGMADMGDGSYLHTKDGEIINTFIIDSEGGVTCVNEKTQEKYTFKEGEDSFEDWTQAVIDLGNVEESEKTEEEPEEESALSQLTDWLKEKGGVVGTAVERERAAILIGQGFYAEGGKVYKEGDAENYYMAEEKEFVKYSMDGKKVAVLDYKDLKEAHNEAAWTQVDTDSKETEDAPTAGTTEEPAPSDKAAESTEIKTEYTKSEIKEKCTYSGTKKLKTPMMDIDVKMNASCPLDRAPQVTADVGEMKVGDQTIPAGSTIEIPKPEKGDIVGMSAMGKPTKYFIYDGSWDSDGVNGLKPIKVTA